MRLESEPTGTSPFLYLYSTGAELVALPDSGE